MGKEKTKTHAGNDRWYDWFTKLKWNVRPIWSFYRLSLFCSLGCKFWSLQRSVLCMNDIHSVCLMPGNWSPSLISSCSYLKGWTHLINVSCFMFFWAAPFFSVCFDSPQGIMGLRLHASVSQVCYVLREITPRRPNVIQVPDEEEAELSHWRFSHVIHRRRRETEKEREDPAVHYQSKPPVTVIHVLHVLTTVKVLADEHTVK